MPSIDPVLISSAALLLSCFTFYWNNLRKTKAFYFLRVSSLNDLRNPQFALINGGTSDILVTSMICRFSNEKKKTGFYPAAQITCEGESLRLISGGKSYHFTAKFLEPFVSSFIQSGEQDLDNPDYYVHSMFVDIEWVETDGTQHKSCIPHTEYSFHSGGTGFMFKPVGGVRHELFANSRDTN